MIVVVDVFRARNRRAAIILPLLLIILGIIAVALGFGIPFYLAFRDSGTQGTVIMIRLVMALVPEQWHNR